MSTSLISKRFLNLKGIRYATIKIPENLDYLYLYGTENIPVEQIAKNVILQDKQSTVMAIIPAANHIQIKSLNAHLQRNLELIQQVNIRGYQLHCAPGRLPCLGEAFGFETIIDESFADSNDIYFTSGNPGELIRISTKDFNLLNSNAWYGKTFSSREKFPSKKASPKNSDKTTPSVSEIRRLVDTINNLHITV